MPVVTIDNFDTYYIPEPNSGCWIWTGKVDKWYGYVWFSHTHKEMSHRLSYKLHKGEIAKGLVVRHMCDNPLCVNPNHLILGTPYDNRMDCVSRGRQAKGEKHGRWNSKLTNEQVIEIRQSATTNKELSEIYKVDRSVISRIKNNKSRSWLSY